MPWRPAAAVVCTLLAACGGGDDGAGGSPGGALPAPGVSARLDRELSGCRPLMAAGLPPALPDEPALRGLCFEAFAVVHDARTRTPRVVLQAIDRASLTAAQAVPRVDDFYEEARLPPAERGTLADYRGSGFDRGHLAPAADMPTVTASAQSFSLANIVPQVPVHNQGAWARIEADTRSYAMRAGGVVYVATGAVFEPAFPAIGPSPVGVPTTLYKLVHDPAAQRSWAHWHDNAADTVAGPPISRAELLQRLGYDPMPGVAGSP